MGCSMPTNRHPQHNHKGKQSQEFPNASTSRLMSLKLNAGKNFSSGKKNQSKKDEEELPVDKIDPIWNSEVNKAHKYSEHFVSTKTNFTNESHAFSNNNILNFDAHNASLNSLCNENSLLLNKEFDSTADLNISRASDQNGYSSILGEALQPDFQSGENPVDLSRIPSKWDNRYFPQYQNCQSKRKQNFELEISDFPKYKFFNEEDKF
jgi:hypothetical protein